MLIEKLKSPAPVVRAAAIDTLAELRAADAGAAVGVLLRDRDPGVSVPEQHSNRSARIRSAKLRQCIDGRRADDRRRALELFDEHRRRAQPGPAAGLLYDLCKH